MSDLTGQKPKDTFGRLLQIANANDGADATLRVVRDGKGDATPLYLSTTGVGIGNGDANYITIAGGAAGNPVTITGGGETSPDVRVVLPSRGLVNVPRMAVGSNTTGANVAAPRLFSLYNDQTYASTGGAVARFGGILRGTLTAAQEGFYQFVVDEDRVAMSSADDSSDVVHTSATMRAGWAGGRTLAKDQLYVGNPSSPGSGSAGSAGDGAYHVAGASFAYSHTDAGGAVGDERGNLFGRNDAVRVRSGSGYHWNSAFGNETDVGVEASQEVLWKGGIKVVQWSTDASRGAIQDYAYGINLQSGGTAPGWRIGYALGGFEGWWPFTADSTVMKAIDANAAGGPSKAFAAGIDFRGITIGESAFASPGYMVDGSGRVGALVASGVALQTRSAINAATAVVASATVLEGGLYSGAITLTGSAPTTSGTTATFSVATASMPYVEQINAAGTGYAVGDTVTYVGGTSTTVTVGTVTKVNGTGGVQGIKITTAGNYSVLPSSPIATTTSGSGVGLTITPKTSILTVTVTNAGTNYSEWLPPTVTSAGASATYRQALIKVAMTATAAPILLANNYANYATLTGAASGGTFDASAFVAQAAGADTHIDFKVLGKGTNGRLNTSKLYVGASANRTSAGDATLTYLRSGMTYSTTADPGFHVSGGFGGTVTSGQAFYHQFAINSDTVDPTTGSGPQGTFGVYVGHTVSAGAKGGRTTLNSFLTVTGAITASASGDGAFLTSLGAQAYASASAGGSAGLGNGRGNLFGGNRIASLLSGATFWNSLVGDEITLAAATGSSLYYKNGFQIVLGSTDAVAGTGGFDSGLLFTQQINGASPGWDEGISFGHALGWWPIKSTGTMIGTVPSTGGLGPAYAAAYGVDFSAVTFSTAAFKSSGFNVDGSGTTTTNGQILALRVVTAAGDVTVSATDDVIVVNKTVGAATTVNLPAGVTGRRYIIKDGKGDSAANNITITPAAGNIDSAATLVINTNYGRVTLVYNGTQWNRIA